MLRKETYTIIESADKPILIDTTYQENSKPKKVVVFSHGFKGFKDWGPFNKIADTFAENDFVSSLIYTDQKLFAEETGTVFFISREEISITGGAISFPG